MQLAATALPIMTMEIPSTPLGPVPRRPVKTIEEASVIFCAIRDRLGAGSSEISDALIRNEQQRVVAYVSYNGRVWWGSPGHWKPGAKPIFSP
ncbi:MAG: hypothetical protein L0191_19345 [Acidobacteria bacterium]|nr:hypothetical protein [Acidobacteriota bacterium]